VRAANLRCVEGSVRVLLDRSNALVGDPVLELARLAEFARLPDGRRVPVRGARRRGCGDR
jgi:hypothetical protein